MARLAERLCIIKVKLRTTDSDFNDMVYFFSRSSTFYTREVIALQSLFTNFFPVVYPPVFFKELGLTFAATVVNPPAGKRFVAIHT